MLFRKDRHSSTEKVIIIRYHFIFDAIVFSLLMWWLITLINHRDSITILQGQWWDILFYIFIFNFLAYILLVVWNVYSLIKAIHIEQRGKEFHIENKKTLDTFKKKQWSSTFTSNAKK